MSCLLIIYFYFVIDFKPFNAAFQDLELMCLWTGFKHLHPISSAFQNSQNDLRQFVTKIQLHECVCYL